MDVPFINLSAMTGDVRTKVSDAWLALLDSNRFIGGEAVDRFESQWAAYCGTTQAVGVANGTDAIHLTLRAMGIGQGDEVVVPANSFVATAEAVVLAGATPRFADVDPATLLLTADDLEAAVTSRTRAVIVVHLYGQMADMDSLSRAAERLGIGTRRGVARAARRIGRPSRLLQLLPGQESRRVRRCRRGRHLGCGPGRAVARPARPRPHEWVALSARVPGHEQSP